MTSGVFTIPAIGHGYEYNRSGQIKAHSDPSGTRTLAYYKGRLSGSLYTAGVLKGYQLIPGRDEFGRQTGTLLKRDGNTIHTTAKALNDVSDQVTNLGSGNITATPQRNAAGNITGYIWSDGTNTVTQTWTRGAGGRLEEANSDVTGAPSFDYTVGENSFDAFGRRLKCETAGGTWSYTYGAGGQLTSATHPTLGTFNYAFDGIGRRTDKGEANTTDILNRTTAWTHNQNKTLSIKAHPDARVWFNGVEIQNFTGNYQAAITPPGAEGGWVPWETLAILEDAGEGAGNPATNPLASPDAKSEKSGAVWVPPTAETFTFDAAGNRQSSAQFNYGWDAKNQLTRVRTKNHTTAAQAYDLTFTYDSEGRRIKKHVIEYQNGSVVSEKIITFIWDGWDLLYERHQLPSGLTTLERKYLWGSDIADGSAGGAGGLLLIRETKGNATTAIIPLYDGTGHVVALTDINKNLLASYAYGPFGEKISAEGTLAQSNPWRFQTKYRDEETGLYYYGHRVYDPHTGQFLSREPLGESESLNLYSYCHNDPINNVDVLGLRKKEIVSTDAKNRFRRNANGEWEVRIVTVETGFWGNKSDYVREEWQSVSTGQNRLRLLGYAGYDEGGGITTSGSDFIQAASAATGWDENSMKEGTIGAMVAIPSLVVAPMAIGYGIVAAPAIYTAGYVKATGAAIALQSSPWGVPIAGGVVTTGAMLLDGEDPGTAISSGGLQALTGRATSAPINWSAMRPSNWMPQQFFPSYGGRPGFASGMVLNPFAQTPSRPPAAYSVAMEVQLAPNQMGLSDGKHFNIANMALNQVRATNTIFAENVPAPARWGRAPNGWVWHHARTDQTGGRAGVMQLVPSDQHSSGSDWWRIFHPLPGGWGGYHEWAVPAGAPPRKR
jgi:RHS repeat-associated protein